MGQVDDGKRHGQRVDTYRWCNISRGDMHRKKIQDGLDHIWFKLLWLCIAPI
jgi:hypothetical protein